MIPGTYDIEIIRGDTWIFKVSHKDSQGVYTNFQDDYLDKGGVGLGEIRMQIRPAFAVRPEVTKADPLLTVSTTTGEITVETTVLTIEISATVTAALDFNAGKYDIECVTGETPKVVHKVLRGQATVDAEITQ